MHESQFLGVQGVARHDFEAVVDELLVLREGGAFQDDIATIEAVVEQRVSDELRVGAYLVGATCLQTVFVKGHIAKAFQHFPVGDGFLALLAVRIDGHAAAVVLAAPNVAYDGAFVLIEIAPNQGVIAAVDGVVEELLGQDSLGSLVFGYNHQSGGVLVDAVDEIADAVFHILMPPNPPAC